MVMEISSDNNDCSHFHEFYIIISHPLPNTLHSRKLMQNKRNKIKIKLLIFRMLQFSSAFHSKGNS